MKSPDFIAVILFIWTCAIASAGVITMLGVPWGYALSHTISACFVGTAISTLLTYSVEAYIRRIDKAHSRPSLAPRVSGADAEMEPQP